MRNPLPHVWNAWRWVQAVRGKRWYAVGVTFVSLLFTDVREALWSRTADVKAALLWLAHAPETPSGRWLIVFIAFTAIAIGAWKGRSYREDLIGASREDIERILHVPKEVLRLAAQQSALLMAIQSLTHGEMQLVIYEMKLKELEDGPSRSNWEMDAQYCIDSLLRNAVDALMVPSRLCGLPLNEQAVRFASPDILILDAGLGGTFYPDRHGQFFDTHKYNIAILKREIAPIRGRLDQSLSEIPGKVEALLRD